MFLDQVKNEYSSNDIGLYGNLSYVPIASSINEQFYNRSISTITPSKLVFKLGENYNTFQSYVALNDNTPIDISVNFLVYADNKLVKCIDNVKVGNFYYINININGVENISLCTESLAICDVIWVNPQVHKELNVYEEDPLQNITCELPKNPYISDKCVFTVINDNYLDYAENMLKSLLKNGKYDDATIVAFYFDANDYATERLSKYGVNVIPCKMKNPLYGTSLKTIIYKITDIVWAKKYMYIDSDMLILDNLNPLFDTLDYLYPNTFLAVKHSDRSSLYTLGESILSTNFGGKANDVLILGLSELEQNSTCVINSGFFVTNDRTMLSINHTIETLLPNIKIWMMDCSGSLVREEAVLLSALARTQSCVYIDDTYNLQLHDINVLNKITIDENRVYYKNKPAKILHFTGNTKIDEYPKYLELINNH